MLLDQTSVNFWRWKTIAPTPRPDRTIPESQKDEKYHAECGRHYLGRQETLYSDWFRIMAAINTGFANEQLWGMPEDKELFLMNKGRSTTRRALRSPLIRPMVTRLVGQLSKMSVAARAEAVTQLAKSRREEFINQAVLFARAAQAGSEMAMAMESLGVTPDEKEAEDMANSSYQDKFVKATNSLLTMISQKNRLEDMRKSIGEQIALSGLAAAHAFVHGNDLRWEFLQYDEVGWDTAAVKPDMTDGEYCFAFKLIPVTTLAERFQPKADQIRALDQMTKTPSGDYDPQRKWPGEYPRVATVYWKDMKYVTKGFVEGPFGPELVDIDAKDPDTGKPLYKESDLIDPPETMFTKSWSGKTDRRAVEVVRYCTFIPYEYQPTGTGKMEPQSVRDKSGDMVLDWGEYPLQEFDPDDVYSVKFPIKFSTWSYLSGFVVAPVSAAVSPQRVLNQVLSDVVWRMSKAKGGSRILDKNAIVSAGMNVKEALFNLAEGDDIVIDGHALSGIPQSIGHAEGGLDRGFAEMVNMVDVLRQMAEKSTGIYEENYGAPGSANELVGVKQLQLQQASIMQQPFTDAVQRLFEQVHQFNAQAGRQWYIRHPWVLEDMVGTDGLDVLDASGDMQYEQFRVEVKLALNSDEVKQASDNMALQFMQMGLLDQASVAKLLGRSYPEDVYDAARLYTEEAKAAAMAQAEAQAQAQQDAAMAQEEMMLAQQEMDQYNKLADVALKGEQLNQKAQQPVAQALSEHLKPVDPNAQAAML